MFALKPLEHSAHSAIKLKSWLSLRHIKLRLGLLPEQCQQKYSGNFFEAFLFFSLWIVIRESEISRLFKRLLGLVACSDEVDYWPTCTCKCNNTKIAADSLGR